MISPVWIAGCLRADESIKRVRETVLDKLRPEIVEIIPDDKKIYINFTLLSDGKNPRSISQIHFYGQLSYGNF